MNEILEKFISWTKLKFKIHTSGDISFYFYEREIWWAKLGMNVGVEIVGNGNEFERPVLILKKFNEKHLLIIPLTRGGEDTKFYYEIKDKNVKNSFLILSQIRAISSRRLTRKMGVISINEFNEVKKKMVYLLK